MFCSIQFLRQVIKRNSDFLQFYQRTQTLFNLKLIYFYDFVYLHNVLYFSNRVTSFYKMAGLLLFLFLFMPALAPPSDYIIRSLFFFMTSRTGVFYKKMFLEISQKVGGRNFLLKQPTAKSRKLLTIFAKSPGLQLYEKETKTQVLFCECWENLKNNSFGELQQTDASRILKVTLN